MNLLSNLLEGTATDVGHGESAPMNGVHEGIPENDPRGDREDDNSQQSTSHQRKFSMKGPAS
jgi:hypothetical protein